MDFLSLLKISYISLSKNKIRSTLTILGIVIGIFSVVTLMALGQGAQNYIVDQVATQGGTNLIAILPGKADSNFSAPPAQQGMSITSLTLHDSNEIEKRLVGDTIEYVAPEIRSQFKTTSTYQKIDAVVVGTNQNYFIIRNTKITSGIPFTQKDSDSVTNNAIIGPKIATILFPNQDPLGQTIKINQMNFRIIGITESKGIEDGQDKDKFIYIPITTAQKKLLGINHLYTVYAQATSKESLPVAKLQIASILRDQHGINDPSKDDFTIYDTVEALKMLGEITNILSILLAAIAAISLIVGGIGIMNIMLVTVTERTREIGLRKAIGATASDIRTQFLIEAIILTMFGGIIGIGLGYAVVILVKLFSTFDPAISLNSILLSLGVSTLFGVVFGLYPANKASRLDPIEALRYE